MKRIYASLIIIAALLAVSCYSSYRVEKFSDHISENLTCAINALGRNDLAAARTALSDAAAQCDSMREKMNHLLRTEDFTELEAALRAADGHLEQNAPEEAFGELRRAQVQIETLKWLSQRFL